MFNFEKFVNSAFYRYTDLIYKMIVINLLVCLVSFPIITLVPALVSGYSCLKFYLEDREAPIFKFFFRTFKENFIRHLILSILILGSGYFLLFVVSSYYEQIDKGLFYIIGLLVAILVVFIHIIIFSYVPLTSIYYKQAKATDILKISLYMGMKHPMHMILTLFSLLIPIFIFERLLILFGFIGVSIYIFLNIKINQRLYDSITRKRGTTDGPVGN